ncbi:MAG: hypothetical protein EOP04_28610, partial [Proteobacteria bacterium]
MAKQTCPLKELFTESLGRSFGYRVRQRELLRSFKALAQLRSVDTSLFSYTCFETVKERVAICDYKQVCQIEINYTHLITRNKRKVRWDRSGWVIADEKYFQRHYPNRKKAKDYNLILEDFFDMHKHLFL